MSQVWFDCESAWDGFIDTAPCRIDVSALVAAPREDVWRAIVDPVERVNWPAGMEDVLWLSPPPHGVGAERRVVHAQWRADGRVAVFEPSRRFSYYFVRAGAPGLSQFMEEFTLDQERWGTRVTWRLGWRFKLPLRPLGPLTVALGKPLLAGYLEALREKFAAPPQAPTASTRDSAQRTPGKDSSESWPTP